jgi:hypothetical protein
VRDRPDWAIIRINEGKDSPERQKNLVINGKINYISRVDENK